MVSHKNSFNILVHSSTPKTCDINLNETTNPKIKEEETICLTITIARNDCSRMLRSDGGFLPTALPPRGGKNRSEQTGRSDGIIEKGGGGKQERGRLPPEPTVHPIQARFNSGPFRVP